MDSRVQFSFSFRSKDTTSRSMRENDKDGKVGLMKSLRQNWRRIASNQSCSYQPGCGLTYFQNLEAKGSGKGHNASKV